MRFSLSPAVAVTAALSFLTQSVAAERMIQSSSLSVCQDNSQFTASLFNVVFTPANRTITFSFQGVSTINGNVTFQAIAQAYGYTLLNQTLDPCSLNLLGICPMTAGKIPTITSNYEMSQSVVDQIPGIAYGIPDLDALVTVNIYAKAAPTVSLACLQARLTNGQTVDQKGVGWATAAVAGLGLITSAVVSGLGHSNTAAHIASYALSLFSYFQAIAICGLVAVPLPPIVQGWTQDFDWTMGIIEVDFMQDIATWYQTATGGTPATVLDTLTTTSVQVLRRSLPEYVTKRQIPAYAAAAGKAVRDIYKRSSYQNSINTVTGTYVVRGINRVAFKAGMEATNVFMTGLAFFCIFVTFTILAVLLFKGFCELAVKQKWMKSDRFLDFRNGWQVVLKGIMFRMVLIGYPQMTILCLWEFTQVDSPAEVVLAIFFFFGMSATLGWAAFKVVRIAKRSEQMHKNPAYILYSDPSALNKWGFLYVQFRASAYYYILPMLVYTIVKAMFVSLGQPSGAAQSVGLLIIEAVALIGASVLRPWMDKNTNTVNIAICSMNFVNSIFLLVFSNVFNPPALVLGVMGVLFFLFNAIFALVLLILVVVVVVIAIVRKNPDARYQPMTDDRASFIKSQTALTTELDALGATARGDAKGPGFKNGLDLDDDNDSWSSGSLRQKEAAGMPLPPSTAGSNHLEQPRSPMNPNTPFLGAGPRGPQGFNNGPDPRNNPFQNSYQVDSRSNSDMPMLSQGARSTNASPAPYARAGSSHSNAPSQFRSQNNASPAGFRSQNNAR
jgi:uncharacterized membrane protein